MKKRTKNTPTRVSYLSLLLVFLVALTTLGGCAVGTRLHKSVARAEEVNGTYTLYLIGCRYASDIETMALLVSSSSPYPFDLVSPPAAYRTESGVAGRDALTEASAFVQCGIYTTGASVLRSIADPSGDILAFEVKPLYPPLEMTVDEVLSSDYFLRDGRVRAFFELLPQVKRVREFDIPARGDP